MEYTKNFKNMCAIFLLASLFVFLADSAFAVEKSKLGTTSDFVEEELYEPVSELVRTVWGFKLWTIDNRAVTVTLPLYLQHF